MALWGTTDQTADKPLNLTSAEKTATAGISYSTKNNSLAPM